MFPNVNIVGPVLFDCVTNSGVTNSVACWEDWICWLLLPFNKDASASLFITIMEMRRKFPGVQIIAISGGGQIPAEEYLDLAARFPERIHVVAASGTPDEVFSRIAPLIDTWISSAR